jgi:hypothetical protein
LLNSYILNVTDSIPNFFASNSAFKYLRLPLQDSTTQILDLDMHLQPAHDFIDACLLEKKRVLVHCACGVSRSPTIVISYLLNRQKHQYATLVDAYAAVTAKRPCVNVNIGFRKQLVALEWLYNARQTTTPSQQDEQCGTTRIVNALCELCFPDFERGVVASLVNRFWASWENCHKNYDIINQIERSLYCVYNGKESDTH